MLRYSNYCDNIHYNNSLYWLCNKIHAKMNTQKMWDNSCRLCSEEKIEMLPIFSGEGLRRRVPQKLRVCLPVMVYKTDPLPKQICQFCAARLDDVFEFREFCLSVYKNMHLKLLARSNSSSVKIFLEAMLHSPDPCQVQLCMMKQRAPPPLVPLPINNSIPLSESIPRVEHTNVIVEPLVELPCEVYIKEEPYNTTAESNLFLDGDNINQSSALENSVENKGSSDNDSHSESSNNDNKTSILEQVLTGNLTINDCQELVPKTKSSSEWWCSPCNNYYRTQENLVKHMQLYCPHRYTCGKCSLVLKTVEELTEHEAENHPKMNLDFDESVKECHECDREFVSLEMLRLHQLRDHLTKSVEFPTNTWCTLCNRFLPNEELYRNHQQLHETGGLLNVAEHVTIDDMETGEDLKEIKKEHFIGSSKSLTCSTCGKVCTQQSALSNHMRTHEPKKHKCDICGRSFGLFIRLAAHKLSEHNVQPTMSPIMTSVEQEEALNAEREAREAHERKFINSSRCRTFSETLDDDEPPGNEQRSSKRSALININASKNVARCGICQEWFNDHTTMLTHLQTHSDSVSPKNFNGSTCRNIIKGKWGSHKHEASHKHAKASVHECSVCSKPFSDKAQLDVHEKIHIVDKTYHCPKCNKIFFKELSLVTHQCTGVAYSTKRNTAAARINQQKSTPFVDDAKFKFPKCPDMFDTPQLRNLHTRIHVKPKLSSPSVDSDHDDTHSMPKLKPQILSGTSIPVLEPKVEITQNRNSLVPQKRTLIKTTGGYRCGVCQSPFILRELAVAHLRSAHPVMPYQCPYCKKRFTDQYAFTHHIKTDHPDESEK